MLFYIRTQNALPTDVNVLTYGRKTPDFRMYKIVYKYWCLCALEAIIFYERSSLFFLPDSLEISATLRHPAVGFKGIRFLHQCEPIQHSIVIVEFDRIYHA